MEEIRLPTDDDLDTADVNMTVASLKEMLDNFPDDSLLEFMFGSIFLQRITSRAADSGPRICRLMFTVPPPIEAPAKTVAGLIGRLMRFDPEASLRIDGGEVAVNTSGDFKECVLSINRTAPRPGS